MRLTFSLLFLALGLTFSKYEPLSREYLSPLECGFNSINETRAPVSLRFFIFAVVFVIFDVELVLVLPIVFRPSFNLEALWGFGAVVFLLRVGLYLEWNNKAFDWVS